MSTRVYIAIGSNIEPDANVTAAMAALEGGLGRVRFSPAYRTPAEGFEGDDFINLVAEGSSDASPPELVAWLHQLEHAQGRRRDGLTVGPRTLDLDLLLFGDRVQSHDPPLPHPDIERYPFVLCPLADLAPTGRHPTLGRTFAELWADFAGKACALTPVSVGRAAPHPSPPRG